MDELPSLATPYLGVGLALALGLLIGVERGWSRRQDVAGARVAGIRTFALLGLIGGLAGAAGEFSSALGAVLVAAAAAALLIGYARSLRRDESLSATTTVVGVATLAIGVFAANGHGALASAAAAVMTLILSMRRQLHGWVEQLSERELYAIARFALISIAILPLLPNRALGPYEAWNPRQIWSVVVMVSGLSLAGYAATRRFGATRGLLATAAAGAMVSSTAVTAAAGQPDPLRDGPQAMLEAGVALASAVMFLRVLVLTAVLAPFALPSLAVVVGPAAAVSFGWAGWLILRQRESGPPAADAPSLRNPFDLQPALILGGLVMALSLAGRWVLHHFGDAGLATVLALSGMLDVDSAIITLGGLPPGSLGDVAAGLTLAAPVMMNTLIKAGLTISVAGGGAGWRAAAPLLACIAAAAAGLAMMPAMFGEAASFLRPAG